MIDDVGALFHVGEKLLELRRVILLLVSVAHCWVSFLITLLILQYQVYKCARLQVFYSGLNCLGWFIEKWALRKHNF